MSEKTKIEWATYSFSPWIGCAKVHAGCVNCYAETMAGRLGVTWGLHGTRRRTAESAWKKVERWNRLAGSAKPEKEPSLGGREAEGQGDERAVRPRVFPSLCDPFEDWLGPILDCDGRTLYVCIGESGRRWPTMADLRRDFFALIDRCPNLDFVLLTKRPENVRRMWVRYGVRLDANNKRSDILYRRNCWLLYSASDQATLEAGLPHLLACRDLVPVLGLSLEPLVGPVNLFPKCPPEFRSWLGRDRINWVIVGGESGPNARPCNVEWIRSTVRQCRAAGVPCFVKQLGARFFDEANGIAGRDLRGEFVDPLLSHRLRDPKGGDPSEWPEDLRVREFPMEVCR